MSFKKEFRELKLSRLEKEDSGIFIKNNLFNFFDFFIKSSRKAKNLLKEDGVVLTGSHALSCYYLKNGKKIFNRKNFNDWDILIQKDKFLEISKKNKFYDLNKIKNNVYTLQREQGAYGVTGTPIHLIIVDELPKYNKLGEYKISVLEDMIKFKMDFVEEALKRIYFSQENQKHYNDLTNIFMNLNH